MDIRTTIERKIKAAGLSKKQFAERAGIIPTNLNGMMTTPTWITLERFAVALGVSVSELVKDDDGDAPGGAPGSSAVCPHCGRSVPLVVGVAGAPHSPDDPPTE